MLPLSPGEEMAIEIIEESSPRSGYTTQPGVSTPGNRPKPHRALKGRKIITWWAHRSAIRVWVECHPGQSKTEDEDEHENDYDFGTRPIGDRRAGERAAKAKLRENRTSPKL